MSQLVGIIANQRFLGKTNPIMTAAVADGGSIQDREYIQRAARGIVDAGHWSNLKFWGCAGLAKLRNSGGVDYLPKLYDLSGNGNDGVQTTEANQPVWGATGLDFDGSNDSIIVPYDSDINLQTLTMCIWVKRVGNITAANQTFLARGVASTPTEVPYRFRFENTGVPGNYYLSLDFFTNATTYIVQDTAGIATTANTWYFYVGTFEKDGTNTNAKIYRNGSLIDSATHAAVLPQRDTNLFIGSENARRWLDCETNDIRIYNTALTGDQITAIYNQTSYRYA